MEELVHMAKAKKSDLDAPGLSDATSGNTGSPSYTADQPAGSSLTLGSSPTPAEAEKAVVTETAAAAKEASSAARVLTSVPLRVFAQISGVKAAEFRGFEVYAVREEMRPCPVPEWKDRLDAFRNKPTQALRRFTR